jgi:hypothetical protein
MQTELMVSLCSNINDSSQQIDTDKTVTQVWQLQHSYTDVK